MSPSLLTPVNLYCERLGPDFWAEPVNALSNAAFFIAAWYAGRLLAARGQLRSVTGWLLTLLIVVIGIGSFLFHTFAVRWALLADVIPISVYQVVFLACYLRQVARMSRWAVGMWLMAFFLATYAIGALPQQWLNGSVASYGSAWLFIAGLGVYHWRSGKQAATALLMAAALFSVSLVLRSLDQAICPHFSLGTHMFWHLLNGGVLYLTTHGYIVNLREAGAARQTG